ncbi:DUF4314 domain-containing protein [Nonomuraea sp. NPDC050556]|uniref:DUF4314 domain-containing protein n=1 Tax=Nonomuraea sp. NPDC050556 TaxID=3364369 RepID=UPI0037A4D39A
MHDDLQRGDRIALVRTTDPHTRLKPGELGTITRIDAHPFPDIAIRWDSGSTLSMLPDEGDEIELVHRDERPEIEQTLYGQYTRADLTDRP